MSRQTLLALLLLAIAGCTTYKVWTLAEGDQDTGTVSLTYEYSRLESPQVDERAGVSMARERCADWGYTDAHRKGEDRQCVEGEDSSCKRWRVIRQYRCDKQQK